jgi:hypothetical protein
MSGFGVSSNISDVRAQLAAFARTLPRVTASALNTLSNAGQNRQREVTKTAFTLRQEQFILRTIYRMPQEDFATPQKLSAGYRIDPRRDYLAKFEKGGTKHAIQGKDYVAIPLPDLRRTKRGLVPRKLIPSAFKPWIDKGAVAFGAQRTFIVPTKSGNRVLLQQYGGSRGKHGVRALYLFVPSVHIDPLLHFEETARAVARSQWPKIFAEAWTQALRAVR